MEIYPDDLSDRFKNYIEKNGEKFNEDKHFFYIDCTVKPQKFVISEWNYKIKKPSLDDLGIIIFDPKDRALSKEIGEETLDDNNLVVENKSFDSAKAHEPEFDILSLLPDVQKNLEH